MILLIQQVSQCDFSGTVTRAKLQNCSFVNVGKYLFDFFQNKKASKRFYLFLYYSSLFAHEVVKGTHRGPQRVNCLRQKYSGILILFQVLLKK